MLVKLTSALLWCLLARIGLFFLGGGGGGRGSDGGIISDLSPPTMFFNRLGFSEDS